MRWRDLRRSSEVEDRRGMRIPGGGYGIGGCGLLVVIAIALLTGQNPLQLLSQLETPSADVQPGLPGELPGPGGGPDDELSQFAAAVLGSTEDVWNEVFASAGQSYRRPKLVLFTDAVQSACGMSSAAVGPFYCPADEKLYLDLAFFDELSRRFGAPGDFAQAYVIAHEVGHHVQNLLGLAERVSRAQQRAASEREANSLSVALELQADCLAGVWASRANRERELLEPGEVEEGLGAAAAVGDDRMQRSATGTVRPESWTHGSSEQRTSWFGRGFQSGDPNACETLR